MTTATAARLATVLFAAAGAPALADPISFRGIDWSMSEAEQVAVLEDAGLDCVYEPAWGMLTWFTPPSPAEVAMEDPLPSCYANKGEGLDVEALRQAYANWELACPRKDDRSSECGASGRHFSDLETTLLMVQFQKGGKIRFTCEFTGTCSYTPEVIIGELQRRVLRADFNQSSENPDLYCAEGEEGDQICLLTVLGSNSVILIQNPSQGTMQF